MFRAVGEFTATSDFKPVVDFPNVRGASDGDICNESFGRFAGDCPVDLIAWYVIGRSRGGVGGGDDNIDTGICGI